MKKIEHEAVHRVGTGNLRLQVTIGEGQFGSSLVVVGAKLFPQCREFDEDLGLGSELAGKQLTIVSIVTDTNEQTNRTSVRYRLTGGPTEWKQTLSFTVDHERDSVQYVAKIALEA